MPKVTQLVRNGFGCCQFIKVLKRKKSKKKKRKEKLTRGHFLGEERKGPWAEPREIPRDGFGSASQVSDLRRQWLGDAKGLQVRTPPVFSR